MIRLDKLIESRISLLEDQLRKPSGSGVGSEADDSLPDPITWANEVQNAKLDPWQQEVIAFNEPRFLLNCSRQSGKSQVSSLRASYRAKYLKRDQSIIAPTLRQSSVIFRRCLKWVTFHDTEENETVTRSTATEIMLRNGAKIECLPGDRPDFVRGITSPDLIIDEASRIKASLIAAVIPILSTFDDASLMMLSTPAGKTGTFYTEWTAKNVEIPWKKFSIPASMCPRISKSFLLDQRRRLGAALYSQEYECKFISSSLAILDPEAIEELFKDKNPGTLFKTPATDGIGRSMDEWTEWEKKIFTEMMS